MFHNVSLYQFFNFSLIVLSIIVFIDVWVQLKRPLHLKIYFLILTASVGGFSFLMWLNFVNLAILLCFPTLKFLVWSSMALILSYFYLGKEKKWVYRLIGIAFLLLIFSLIKIYNYSDRLELFIGGDGLSPVDLFTQKFSFKVNLIPRVLILAIFTFINLRIVYLIYKKANSENIYYDKIKNWTRTFVVLEVVSVTVFGIMNSTLFSFDVGSTMLIFMGYFILILVLYRPRFLNSQSSKLSLLANFNRDSAFALTDANFYTPFFLNQYYLNEAATLEHFCNLNGISATENLQDQIVLKYNMSFSNLINKSRVDYFIELVKSPKFRHYSIDALAKEAGFNSRHHLYKPFKKFHGGTPSDFINSINS